MKLDGFVPDSNMDPEERAKQQYTFGRNGIVDGNGNIIRTDHGTMQDIWHNAVDRSGVTRQGMLDRKVNAAYQGVNPEQERKLELDRLNIQDVSREVQSESDIVKRLKAQAKRERGE